MHPILYNSDGIYFHNGKGKLVDCVSCVVSEELNGDYSLEFTYPVTGPLFNELLDGGSVSVICPHMRLLTGTGFVPMRAAEWFDIYKHSIPINGVVTFYANHVSRRLARLVYAGGKIGTGTGSVDGVLNRSQPSVANGYDGLRFYTTPYSPPAVRDTDVPVQSVLATYIGAENSFVSNFGGDFIWTSDSLYNTQNTPPLTTRGYYVAHRGEDRGAEIRYGFNMTDVENVEDSIDTYNAVVPYWEDSDGNRVFANGFLVQSDPPQTPIRAVPLNCSAWYDTAPTSDQLISTAQNHLANHTPWNVVETLTVDFINGVEIDPHGAEIALGDTVHIYWKDGKIDATLRVVSYKYDVLAERYSELKLGTQQTHFVAVTGAESYSGATGGSSGGGLPSGGTLGQVLAKNSSADGDAIWTDIPPSGASDGDVLTKDSTAPGGVGYAKFEWSLAGATTSKTGTVTYPETAKELFIRMRFSGYAFALCAPVAAIQDITVLSIGGYYYSSSDTGIANVNHNATSKTIQVRNAKYGSVTFTSMEVWYR